jgi:hypothetical protein
MGTSGELGEHFLIFGMSADETEKDLRSDVAVSAGLVPSFADDAAVVRAKPKSSIAIIIGDGRGSGRSDGSRNCSRLNKTFQLILNNNRYKII